MFGHIIPEEEVTFRTENPFVTVQTDEATHQLLAHAWPTEAEAKWAAENHLRSYFGQVMNWNDYLNYKVNRFAAWGITLPTEFSRY